MNSESPGERGMSFRAARYGAIALASALALNLMLSYPTVAGKTLDNNDHKTFGEIERQDPRIDDLLPRDEGLEVVAEGFRWLEGPAWNKAESYLLFSDIPQNAIFRWDAEKGVSLYLKPSGYSGKQRFAGKEPGSNGLVFDLSNRLVICQHGNRRIVRIEPDGRETILADRYQGKRLNSPNDAVFHSNGDLYFTDPPFGLPSTFQDPDKELPFSGVYKRAADGELVLLTDRLRAPNGIAFSPSEKKLYVSDVDPARPAWWVFNVLPDGNLDEGRIFFNASRWQGKREGGPDGIEVDEQGHVYGAGPEGVYVFAPDATHLGTFFTGVPTGNLEWGDDGSMLYITADTRVLRLRLKTRGVRY